MAHEYQARDDKGRVVGNCVFLKEAGDSGLWRYAVKGHGGYTCENREDALLAFSKKCNEAHSAKVVAA